MPRILIAEDEPILLKMYKFNFEQEGFEVVTAVNGEEAVAAMDAAQPDGMLLDLLMPKLDGFGVMEHVRAKKYAFPVIVLSNLSQDIDQKKCRELGATDFFIKSDMDLPRLIEKMRGLV